ncbi:MAG: thiamine phosphate synthase [Candidatus Omnitrophica bacterium]|nr:thiamine phosphate synthase [Candidatus Omnitrophota bacterium]
MKNKTAMLNYSLYCITSQQHSLGRTTLQVAEEMISAGVKIIQYREKDKKTKLEKYNDCLKLRKMTRENGVTFIVNDDADIALAVKADGIHIGQEDMPLDAVRALTGEDFIIGVSTHSPEQAKEAVLKGADYIGVGPIYKTKTKKGVGKPVGLEYLDYVTKNIHIPFVAIGGIKMHNLMEVRQHGGKCVAMVTEIVGAENIKARIYEIFKMLK